MSRNKGLFVTATTLALGILGTVPAAASDHNGNQDRPRAYVVPCSLDGVNPAYHPSIFGNPRVARDEYGFVRSRDGTWHVERNCVPGPYHGG